MKTVRLLSELSAFIFVLLLASACNSDIFVDPVPDMEESISLEGFNGSKTIKFKKKGLKSIHFDHYYGFNWEPYTTYYGHDGSEIRTPKSMDEVSKVISSSNYFALELNFMDDEVEIISLDNAYIAPLDIIVSFDYGYAVKSTIIKIGVGKPYDIVDFNYFIDKYVTTTEVISGIPNTVHNNTPNTVKSIIYPYKDAQSKLTLTPEDDAYWSEHAVGNISIPFFKDGEWTMYKTEDVEATIGTPNSFASGMVNIDEEAYVEIPPNSSVSYRVHVTYAILETGFATTVKMPNTDIERIVWGKLNLRQPIDYYIETKSLLL